MGSIAVRVRNHMRRKTQLSNHSLILLTRVCSESQLMLDSMRYWTTTKLMKEVEVVTAEEQQEQCAFIEEISRTAPVQYLHKYLVAKGVVSDSYKEFKGYLTSIWFALYGRGGTRNSSSAFEHVFVGEIKHNLQEEVSGFHNWIQFYVEEANGRVDYQGYIFPRRRGNVPDSDTQLLTIQFKWKNVLEGVSSSFIGVSPEFELALYTLCFFVGEEDNHVKIGPYHVNIKCYRLGNNKIGSIFPVAED
ncbi:hypothetical protein O6H91_03G119200 [Diphasiastrum complanatum]|uniref:Uncharacterized protein n=1 Tax=Diphasiastrum complanatum TaxID=34168 RepID=A0ACC2EB00_DIPCM|nr:hypothetical protein O6H91_03G119200 [Diphasiastrum complanatum]